MTLETLGQVIGQVIGSAIVAAIWALPVFFAFHTTFAQAFVIALAYEGILNQLRKG
jgi:hypothetical protein